MSNSYTKVKIVPLDKKEVTFIKPTIKKIVESVVNGTWICPECEGKPLGRLCIICQYWDGIPLWELVERGIIK